MYYENREILIYEKKDKQSIRIFNNRICNFNYLCNCYHSYQDVHYTCHPVRDFDEMMVFCKVAKKLRQNNNNNNNNNHAGLFLLFYKTEGMVQLNL